jgi:clan AA aspartic protease
MMVGAVTAGDEAVLTVTVASLSGSLEARVEVVVDTGFTGHLTLRPETVERLALPVVGSAESVLADGSTIVEDFCLARVFWHGTPRSVHALVVDAIPLLGMSLLRGSELRVRAEPGGEVVVRPLS